MRDARRCLMRHVQKSKLVERFILEWPSTYALNLKVILFEKRLDIPSIASFHTFIVSKETHLEGMIHTQGWNKLERILRVS